MCEDFSCRSGGCLIASLFGWTMKKMRWQSVFSGNILIYILQHGNSTTTWISLKRSMMIFLTILANAIRIAVLKHWWLKTMEHLQLHVASERWVHFIIICPPLFCIYKNMVTVTILIFSGCCFIWMCNDDSNLDYCTMYSSAEDWMENHRPHPLHDWSLSNVYLTDSIVKLL